MFKKIRLNYVLVIIGALVMLFGIYLVFQQALCDRTFTPYAGLILGGGAGLSAVGIANIYYIKNPKFAKMKSIEENDERNKLLYDKAYSKTYKINIYALSIIAVIAAFYNSESIWLLLSLGGLLLMNAFLPIILFSKSKK